MNEVIFKILQIFVLQPRILKVFLEHQNIFFPVGQNKFDKKIPFLTLFFTKVLCFHLFCMIFAFTNHRFNYEWNSIVILSILNAISNYFTLCTKEIFSFLYDIKTFSKEAKRWRAAKRLPCFEQPILNDRFCNLSSKIIEFSHDPSKLTIVKIALL